MSGFGRAEVDDEEWVMAFVGADARYICSSGSSFFDFTVYNQIEREYTYIKSPLSSP